MIADRTAYVEWDVASILNSIGASVEFRKGGKKTFWGLEYKSKPGNKWFAASFWSSLGGLAIILIIRSIL